MKTIKFVVCAFVISGLCSCVSSKKYKSLNSDYKKLMASEKRCDELLRTAQVQNTELINQNKSLNTQVDYLKQNSNKVLGALQDMSVLSAKQAESIQKSLENITEKDIYIRSLNQAISRKDSINLILVTNLKSILDDVNDKDINIKVEKGVVYIDISDKLLFNSGKFAVTDNARKVLGKVAKVLNAYPDIEFTVEGHTDTVPIRTECLYDNWDLSVKRATSVIRILQQEYKILPERMTASGHSEYIPVTTNATDEGRALNRRTRIIILPQLDQFFKLLVRK